MILVSWKLTPATGKNGCVRPLSRAYSIWTGLKSPVVHIPTANVYRFGDSNASRPVFQDLQWTVNEGDSWAVVSSGSGEKTALFQMLLGHLRIAPPPRTGLFPFLSHNVAGIPRDPHTCISMVSFGSRRRASGGAFYDYSARYGAVRDEDRITLRQSMFPESQVIGTSSVCLSDKDQELFNYLVKKMELQSLLDLPVVALSNGQTRRARIIKAILSKPELLLLDEPLTGLDVQNRPTLLQVLRSLHSTRSPRIIMGLRTQDPIPDWITHVAFVNERKVSAGKKEEVLANVAKVEKARADNSAVTPPRAGKVLVDMKNVGVKYGPRVVLKDINWKIRQGERWHLQGANGSGKTTLLSLLTGDHPQSYTQSHFHLHGLPRSRVPTRRLHSMVGVVSPELFDAFPRRAGMTVWEAVGTGFDGGFVPLGKEGVGIGVMKPLHEETVRWRVARSLEVLEALGPRSWLGERDNDDTTATVSAKALKDREFVDLSVGEQKMVLLMRALVGRPPLVLLDEVWSGMDEGMVSAARKYLRNGGVGEEQGVVVVTHWEEEVPWGLGDGVQRFQLGRGEGGTVV